MKPFYVVYNHSKKVFPVAGYSYDIVLYHTADEATKAATQLSTKLPQDKLVVLQAIHAVMAKVEIVQEACSKYDNGTVAIMALPFPK